MAEHGKEVEVTITARVAHPRKEGFVTMLTVIGDAEDPDTGETYTLANAGFAGGSPVIEFEGDTQVKFDWNALVEAAVKAADAEAVDGHE